jgi:hypothetical protein
VASWKDITEEIEKRASHPGDARETMFRLMRDYPELDRGLNALRGRIRVSENQAVGVGIGLFLLGLSYGREETHGKGDQTEDEMV